MIQMTKSYIQRMASVSQLLASPKRTVLTPSLCRIYPAINTHRVLHTASPSLKIHQPTTYIASSKRSLNSTAKTTLRFTQLTPTQDTTITHGSDEPDPLLCDSNLPQAFNFIAYAAWHPKNRSPKQRKTENEIPYWKQLKVGKVDAGEDAFYHTCTPSGLSIGVADGVGGWADVGVDPALFSWTLMNNAAAAAKDENSLDAHHILDTAFHQLQEGGKVEAGSSTACILDLCKMTGKMTTCNLGDSAFLLIRDQKVVYESPSQQHYFNCPYQLTVVPETYPDRDLFVTDMPKDGDQKSFFLKDGDIILLATDGYFDNVYSHETLALVNKTMATVDKEDGDELVAATIRELAKLLTNTAKFLSLDHKRLSPWAKDAQAHGSNYCGGKTDDITLIATLVRGGTQ
ncbi:phosphatase 2C-like domain-containing protein [Absidia repens]|uniref:Protein phosphatase n=1 Tax=Absidia repens TaxID=90262 RepID=A0A1X2INA9_9FUNG|nr:phosphatase 2C-like domain-containing protein [Absidia repens]